MSLNEHSPLGCKSQHLVRTEAIPRVQESTELLVVDLALWTRVARYALSELIIFSAMKDFPQIRTNIPGTTQLLES